MSYAYSYGFDRPTFDKYATIQQDTSDMYLVDEDTDTEMQEIEKDVFGFADAIELDHLTDEQLDEVLAIFGDK
jgi:hypothetical protein